MIFYSGNHMYPVISDFVQAKEMLFIGEYVHGNPQIEKLVCTLAVELAKRTAFKTLARESLYCLYPEFEKASISAQKAKGIQDSIIEYNASVPACNRILVTSIDLAHSIKHSPQRVFDFIEFISKGSLAEQAKKIFEAKTTEEKQAFIEELGNVFLLHEGDFDEATFNEITFYLDLLKVSLADTRSNNQEECLHSIQTRNAWFIKTVERALQRTRNHGSKMICYTGAPHAYKTYTDVEDYYVGPMPEAQYFNEQVYPGTVGSILVRPFFLDYYGNKITEASDPIEQSAYANSGTEQSVYVDLREYQKAFPDAQMHRYCKDGVFQHDGIIYIKDQS